MKGKEQWKHGWLFELARVLPAIILLGVMFVLLALAPEQKAGLQLLIYKVILANAGFLNGHIIRKLAFPNASWLGNEDRGLKILFTVLYAMFIYVYATGG